MTLRILLALAMLATAAQAQQVPEGLRPDIDPQLWNEIAAIKGIDHHSHIPKVTAAGEADDEFDALPVPDQVLPIPPGDGGPTRIPSTSKPTSTSTGIPSMITRPNTSSASTRLKAAAKAQHGEQYPLWVLEKIGTDIIFANRVAMGRGLTDPHHFRWVPFDDALMYPLNNSAYLHRSEVDAFFWPREDALLARYVRESGATVPKTLAAYLVQVVTPTLERQKHTGAVGVKFEMAYLRSLQSESVSQAVAESVYAKYVGGAVPPAEDYTRLQDFLLRYIAKEAGRLSLAVHFHTGAGGTYNFDQRGASVLNLNSLVNDPSLTNTSFVMVHGGVPNTQDASYMMTKKRVYADCSEMDQFLPPRAMAAVLRQWLDWVPEKVMFGSDLSPEMWEEQGYVASRSVRLGLAIALTGMVGDGEITRARASELAHMVLHDNAAKLYGL
ncbi:MAG: hypothetical protein NVS9B15_23860 [Acidobacteriaceae bacterium]